MINESRGSVGDITQQGNRYYEIGQLLHISAKFITIWGSYCKLGQLLQIGL